MTGSKITQILIIFLFRYSARVVATTAASVASNAASAASTGIRAVVQPRQAKVTNNEKTLLLSSDDEFQ